MSVQESRRSKRPRIMIVDDDEDIRLLCRMALEAQGFDVEEASDGSEFLDRLRSGEVPDLILLDIMMPESTGWNVLAELAHDETLPDMKVVMFTALDAPDFRQRATELGAVGYITKPFNQRDLVNVVRNALFGKRDPWG